jgi:hypothetical protein
LSAGPFLGSFLIELREAAIIYRRGQPMTWIAIMALAAPVIICVMLFTAPKAQ